MGAWDAGSFGNDDAADWAWQLEDVDDLSIVDKTLERVFQEMDAGYVEAPTASEAIAACEVIARLKGNYGTRNAYSEAVDNWVTAHQIQPSKEIVAKGNRALDVILKSENSELRDLWEEGESGAEWQTNVLDLKQRMGS